MEYCKVVKFNLFVLGRVLSVQTEEVAVADWPNKIQPDKTHWMEDRQDDVAYFVILRFYLQLVSSTLIQTIR